MTAHNDLPMIQPFPNGTPTDAELQAARDRDHERDVADYDRRMTLHDDWPIGEVTA